MQNSKSIEQRAKFDIIRYASCWEDADILLEALNIKSDGNYLSIASAGDNSFSILSKNPKLVVALDINPVQLACVELKKVAFKKLTYKNFYSFLGVDKENDNLKIYKELSGDLSEFAQKYWDSHPEFIKTGIIHIGKFEHYFELFRNYILPLIHNRKTVEQLLKNTTSESQSKFYLDKWNTWRWKLLFKIFFSRQVMGRFGRDPEFFKYVETDVASRIFKRAEYALVQLSTDQNPYLEYILKGNFVESLPFYLRKENFDAIKGNIDKLVIFKGNLEETLNNYNQVKFDGFNLSDIFEYMSQDLYKQQMEIIIQHSNKNARIVFWNMLAERKIFSGYEAKLKFIDDLAKNLFDKDKAFFYKSLVIGEIE